MKLRDYIEIIIICILVVTIMNAAWALISGRGV